MKPTENNAINLHLMAVASCIFERQYMGTANTPKSIDTLTALCAMITVDVLLQKRFPTDVTEAQRVCVEEAIARSTRKNKV